MGQGTSTRLLAAAQDGDIATVRRLLTKGGVDVNVKDENYATPLYVASQNGHHFVVQALVGAGADVNMVISDGQTVENSAVSITFRVQRTPPSGPGSRELLLHQNGWSPLMIASDKGHLDVVKALIEAGANVHHTAKDNVTPLYMACQNGHHFVVQTLLRAGADVNITTSDIYGWSLLIVASEKGHLDVVITLIEAGANVNHTDTSGLSPLMKASWSQHLDVVKTLIEAGANVNHCDKEGWNPLMLAVKKGNVDIVKTLIEAGANGNHTNKDGQTALDIAVGKGHKDIIEVLKIPQSKNDNGREN